MDKATALFPLCAHIKSDGNRCGSAALKGMNLCFQHIGGSIVSARARATSIANAGLKFVYPSDREAIQHNLFLVAQALVDGKMDTAMANTLNRIFRTCELNLRRSEAEKLSRVAGDIPEDEILSTERDLRETVTQPGRIPETSDQELRDQRPPLDDQESRTEGEDNHQPPPISSGAVLNEESCPDRSQQTWFSDVEVKMNRSAHAEVSAHNSSSVEWKGAGGELSKFGSKTPVPEPWDSQKPASRVGER